MNSTVTKVARILLAIIMLVFGANKFFSFLPMPPLPEEAGAFMGALGESGYIFPILGIVYILVGLCLLFNKAVPFALVMLVPVSINIVAFHLRFDPEGVGAAALVAILNLFLLYVYFDKLKALFE
ncbi:DoxX protein [Polaribacter sp. HL-MS24]|uniref:DoxX protein n=1 Tax=Polaribacter sp. HL-MS24 TaxID=3077735 RepID=UPI00293423BF|nr:DoxX protein [Polaribacter sp. HL-MS24]WOC41148.1 DoxX protein [Polaribacter sp. HL-MS24]